MQQFQSLQRLLLFYSLTLLVMLSLYYAMIFLDLEAQHEQASVDTFNLLQHELIEHAAPVNAEISHILKKPFLQDISYQLVFMLPSGQTYLHRYTRPNERAFTAVSFPSIVSPISNPSNSSNSSAYTLNARNLTGTIRLESGQQIYVILRHQTPAINWLSYRYWLPLMTAIILFIIALLYMLKRQANWQLLLRYSDNLSSDAKEAYTPPPFIEKKSTAEFLRLGHALSRISYQLHNNERGIKTLKHRLERLVEHAPLPMLMIMRHGKISFVNQRFEQVFATSFQRDSHYQLTDFVAANDESTKQQLQQLATQRVSRTLIVYGLENKQAYQLHITPWFGEHEQVHGFTVIINDINELVNQTQHLQQQNLQLQHQLDELSTLRSVIAHELRTPLANITDILEQIDPNTLSTQQYEVLSTLIQSSHAMLAMLNDMLEVGKVATKKAHLSTEPVDLYKLGQHLCELTTDHARQQGLALLYFFAPDCPRFIETDDQRLRHILLNLLDSAVESTTTGYVALTIEAVSAKQLAQTQGDSVTLNHKNDIQDNAPPWVRFSVQNTGTGREATQHPQLLGHFNQTDRQSNKQTSQQAIETEPKLATAKSFAQLLGGFIEVESMVNTGSSFTLYLPCRRPSYQPVYHLNPYLTQIHLIAIVQQPLSAAHLQRLCQYLSISTSIYTSIDSATIEHITAQLAQNGQTLAPVLLLDYESYSANIIDLAEPPEDAAQNNIHKEQGQPEAGFITINQREENDKKDIHTAENNPAQNDKAVIAIDRRQALNNLLATPSLPKILLSMKPERRIPSVLLDQCDGFLAKPMDNTLLLSELLRLTVPVRQLLTKQPNLGSDHSQITTSVEGTVDEILAPLILVAEDSPTNQKITCKILTKLGYRSVVAEDGQQALDKLQAQRQEIALILMDCRMPVMDGLQATQAIRAQGDDIPIVALTANTTAEDREACMQVGMDEFLSKPINKAKLEVILQSLIKV